MAAGETQMGKPYVWGGKSPSTSFDCSGYVSWCYSQIGVWLPSYTDSIADVTDRIPDSWALPADIVLWRYWDNEQPFTVFPHVSLFSDWSTVLDARYGVPIGYHGWLNTDYEIHRVRGLA